MHQNRTNGSKVRPNIVFHSFFLPLRHYITLYGYIIHPLKTIPMSILVVFHYFFIFPSPRLFKNSSRLSSSTKKLTFRHLRLEASFALWEDHLSKPLNTCPHANKNRSPCRGGTPQYIFRLVSYSPYSGYFAPGTHFAPCGGFTSKF